MDREKSSAGDLQEAEVIQDGREKEYSFETTKKIERSDRFIGRVIGFFSRAKPNASPRHFRGFRALTTLLASPFAMGVGAGLLLVCALAFGFAWGARGLWTQEAASWIQAVGSIFAIWWAGKLSSKAIKATEAIAEVQRQSERQKLWDVVNALSENVHSQFAATEKLFNPVDEPFGRFWYFNFDTDALSETIKHLEDLPLHEIGSGDLVKNVLTLLNSSKNLNSLFILAKNEKRGSGERMTWGPEGDEDHLPDELLKQSMQTHFATLDETFRKIQGTVEFSMMREK